MATQQHETNLKVIQSGTVPTTTTLPVGCFAFGLIGGVPKLYGNSNGTIVDYTSGGGTTGGDLTAIDAEGQHDFTFDDGEFSIDGYKTPNRIYYNVPLPDWWTPIGGGGFEIYNAPPITIRVYQTGSSSYDNWNVEYFEIVEEGEYTPRTYARAYSVDNGYYLNEEWTPLSGYQKPWNGIPKYDLNSSVQSSLNKADSALQLANILAGTNISLTKAGSNVTINATGTGGADGLSIRYYNASQTSTTTAIFALGTFIPTITASEIQAGDTVITSNGYLYRFATAGSNMGTFVKNLNGTSVRYYSGTVSMLNTFSADSFVPPLASIGDIQVGDMAITNDGLLYRFEYWGNGIGTFVIDLKGPQGPKGDTARSVTLTVGFTTDCDYNVTNYNSTNYSSSAQTVINAAINAIPNTGGKIILREGIYNITGNITIASTKNNLVLEGMGHSTILKRMANFTNGVIRCQGATCTISNLAIDGNKGTYTTSTNYGIYIDSNYNTTVENINSSYNINGIYIYGTSSNQTHGNRIINNILNNNSNGIRMFYTYDNIVSGNECNNNSSSGISTLTGYVNESKFENNTCANNSVDGILLYGSNNLVVNNICRYNYNNIYVSGVSASNKSTRNIITGNQLLSTMSAAKTTYGLRLLDTWGCTISNNSCAYTNGYGMYIENSNETIVSSNSITHSENNGMYLKTCSGCSITGNVIPNNNYSGIVLDASVHSDIVGNVIVNNGTYGIHITTGSPYLTITGNWIQGNGYTGINCTSFQCTITGNHIRDGQQRGITVGAENVIIGNNVNTNSGVGIYTTEGGNVIVGNSFVANGGGSMTQVGTNIVANNYTR